MMQVLQSHKSMKIRKSAGSLAEEDKKPIEHKMQLNMQHLMRMQAT